MLFAYILFLFVGECGSAKNALWWLIQGNILFVLIVLIDGTLGGSEHECSLIPVDGPTWSKGKPSWRRLPIADGVTDS